MAFDYESHYKKLISDLTKVLVESIEQMPEKDKDITPCPCCNKETSLPVQYAKKRVKQEPLK